MYSYPSKIVEFPNGHSLLLIGTVFPDFFCKVQKKDKIRSRRSARGNLRLCMVGSIVSPFICWEQGIANFFCKYARWRFHLVCILFVFVTLEKNTYRLGSRKVSKGFKCSRIVQNLGLLRRAFLFRIWTQEYTSWLMERPKASIHCMRNTLPDCISLRYKQFACWQDFFSKIILNKVLHHCAPPLFANL